MFKQILNISIKNTKNYQSIKLQNYQQIIISIIIGTLVNKFG